MAHEVESMMYVNETPWHGLGKVFAEPPKTMEEILEGAGLNWRVNHTPIYSQKGELIEGYKQLSRSDNDYSLAVVGNRYEPMQNHDALASLMPLIESGEAEIETAGSLREGKKIWALLRSNHLKETQLHNGERIKNYFLFSTSHDGSRANRFGKTSVRVVCANTLSMSDKDSSIAFRHTKNQKNILDTLVSFATDANQENERLAAAYNMLLTAKISHVRLQDYIIQVFGLTDSTRGQNLLADIVSKAYFGRGNRDVKGTWWAALNAATEHLSHETGRNQESRLNQLWFGGNQGLLNKATTLAIKAVA